MLFRIFLKIFSIAIFTIILCNPCWAADPDRITNEYLAHGKIYYAHGQDFFVPYDVSSPGYLILDWSRVVQSGGYYCGTAPLVYLSDTYWSGSEFWIKITYHEPVPIALCRGTCGLTCFQYRTIAYVFQSVPGLDPDTYDSDEDGVVDALDWSPNNPDVTEDPDADKEEIYLGVPSHQKHTPCPITDKHGNPISIFTGNKFETQLDLRFPSPFKNDFLFARYYNSQSEKLDSLGYGWSHSYLSNLIVNYKSDPNLIKINDQRSSGYAENRDRRCRGGGVESGLPAFWIR